MDRVSSGISATPVVVLVVLHFSKLPQSPLEVVLWQGLSDNLP
jgi:hypothetical protein